MAIKNRNENLSSRGTFRVDLARNERFIQNTRNTIQNW